MKSDTEEYSVKSGENVYYADGNYDMHFLDDYINENGVIELPERVPVSKLTYTDKDGNVADDELREKLQLAYIECKPVCVYVDGLNVVDDAGGIYGFMDMLEIINSGPAREKSEYKNWAQGMGWTGRKRKEENVL